MGKYGGYAGNLHLNNQPLSTCAFSSASSICLLVVSSSYLAFRIFRLEQQLCSLNRDYLSRGPRR